MRSVKKLGRLVIHLVALSILSSCASSPPRFVPVSAGYLYKGPYLNIHAPNSDGWYMVFSTPEKMEFGKGGTEQFETFAAQVFKFPLPPTTSEEEFLTVIRTGAEADIDPARFSVIESKFEYSDERSYPCVRSSGIVEDHKAQIGQGKTGKLLLQARSLHCRHPLLPDTGVAIIYSHRGQNLYPNLDADANDFIIGVQVPGD